MRPCVQEQGRGMNLRLVCSKPFDFSRCHGGAQYQALISSLPPQQGQAGLGFEPPSVGSRACGLAHAPPGLLHCGISERMVLAIF